MTPAGGDAGGAAAGARPAGTVLLIDDDEDVREVVAMVLEDVGLRVVMASNGREGLDRLRTGPRPDVILLDLMMPVMDGYRFRAEQVQDAALATIPTLIFTAGGIGPRVEALGAAALIRKPVDFKTLVKVIEAVVG
jgi:CheY-like chemotaxis protein